VPLLLGLGVDALSMTPPLIPAVRYLVRAMKMADAKKLAKEALGMSSPKDILTRCLDFYNERTKMQ